jgi:hypothetical protein
MIVRGCDLLNRKRTEFPAPCPIMLVHAVGRPDVPPFAMPARFRTDIAYFMTPSGDHGVAKLPPSEYWIRLDDARTWLEEGVVAVVSPLDSLNKTEFELTDEQENWLRWMVANAVEHVRLE